MENIWPIAPYSLEYNPLVLWKDKPENFNDDKFTLKAHNGNISDLAYMSMNRHDFRKDHRNLGRNSLIEK